MTKQLTVKNPDGTSYPIVFARGFESLPEALKNCGPEPDAVCISSDTHTGPLYAESLAKTLQGFGGRVTQTSFPAGEENKNLSSVTALYDHLLENGFTRKSLLVSLGGGVCGDMTGFAAATYMRGIPFIQIPTTLLSAVDASIGGKTGFDYHDYKNMIGAFHMPSLVYIAMDTLDTLPEREYASGLAEIIKAALIRDEAFYEWLLDHMEEIRAREKETVSEMIFRSCRIKQAVVEKDPTEKNERMLLNFGHTIGHAVEKAKHFSLTHGECVALGMLAAARISAQRGLLPEEELYELRDILVGFGLPIFADGIDTDEIIRITKADKKMQNGQIRFILLKKIGHASVCSDVTDEEMKEAVNFVNGDLLK